MFNRLRNEQALFVQLRIPIRVTMQVIEARVLCYDDIQGCASRTMSLLGPALCAVIADRMPFPGRLIQTHLGLHIKIGVTCVFQS